MWQSENNWSKLVSLCRPWGSNTGCQASQQALLPTQPSCQPQGSRRKARSHSSFSWLSLDSVMLLGNPSPVWAGTKPFDSQPSQAELLPGTGCHFVVPEKQTLLMPRMEVHTYCPAWSSWGFVIRTNNEMSKSLEFGV